MEKKEKIKKKESIKYWHWHLLLGAIRLVALIFLAIFIFNKLGNELNQSCSNSINNICIETTSDFCGCDMATHQCKTREVGLCNLVRCLNKRNVTLYYLNLCPHCQNQLELLKPFENSIRKIECSTGNCGVRVVPTWSNGTITVEGTTEPETLFNIFNCKRVL